MLSDSPNGKLQKSGRNRPIEAATKLRWSDRQKIEAVTTFLMLGGNVIMTSVTSGIPEDTIYKWKATEWWNTMVNDLKQEERLVLSSKLKKVVDKSWDVVADRLEQGDWIYDQKKGEMRRKPVSLRDAANVAKEATNIREKLDMAENFTVQADQIEDKLTKLAKAFSDLAKGIKPPEPAEDIEYVELVNPENEDAVHEKREEGL
jgi:hypothetical protein